MAFLQGPSLKQAEVMKQELGEGPDDLERGIRDLKSMCAASPHLPRPELLSNQILGLFVRGCRMDQERARSKLENFCLSRERCRDLYECRSLNEPPLNGVCKFMDIVPLPRLTDEGYRVTAFRIKRGYPESSADFNGIVRAILLISDCRMHDEKLIAGDVFIFDVKEGRSSIVTRLAGAFSAVRRAIQLAHVAYPQRLKRVHIVGAPPFFNSSVQLFINCVNEKIRKRYYLHSKMDELLDVVPVSVLPEEWGGSEESLDALAKKWRRRVDELRDFVRDLNELCSSPSTKTKDSDIYGTVGAFRKLDID